VTLVVIDERLFLTMFQLILSLHECADPAAAQSATVEFAAEPLQSIVDSAATSAAMTETS
jgi:hypothetical protein